MGERVAKTRVRWNGILAIGIGTVLAVASIALTAWNTLWSSLGIDNDQRTGVATALTILFLNLGFLVGLYFQQNDFKTEVLDAQQHGLQGLRNMIPSLTVFAAYTGEAAMGILTQRLPVATVALNTRILSAKMSETSHAAESPWDVAVRRSVKGGLIFREVVSPDNESLARARLASSGGGRGRYQAAVLRHNLPSFMNFIVLEMSDGRKEVWFGWVVSLTAGWEGTVICTAEHKVVTLFEGWHAELLRAGHFISS
jgi:hypothetical protein